MSKIKYILSSDCMIVDGYSRSAIYDLGRGRLFPVPHSLSQIIKDSDALNQLMKCPSSEIEKEYTAFLNDHELVLSVPESASASFSCLPDDWDFPYELLKAEIHVGDHVENIEALLLKLQEITTYKVVVSAKNKIYINTIAAMLRKYEFNDMCISVHDANEHELHTFQEAHPYVALLEEGQGTRSGKHMPLFIIGYSSFMEARQHNLGLNRCLTVDEYGYISIGGKALYKNIMNSPFDEVKEDSYPLWDIAKDEIAVCNVCEFRYACHDTRLPHKLDAKGVFYMREECCYNPFICRFEGEDGYCDLTHLGMQTDEINYDNYKEQISRYNEALWKESIR